MLKGIDRGITVETRLDAKDGGKSGRYTRARGT
jgi:hypothetical protein